MSVIDEIKNKAKANRKTVVLPETTDMRTLTAAGGRNRGCYSGREERRD